MGYHMTQRDARFHLPRRHFKAALKAVKQLLSAPIYAYHDSPARQRSLPKVLPMLGWEVELHAQTGDIISLIRDGVEFVDSKAPCRLNSYRYLHGATAQPKTPVPPR